MVSHFAIPSKRHLGGVNPYVFTEHGILMLANVLRSGRAIQMSIRIIEIFVQMRELMLVNKEILNTLDELEKRTRKHDEKIQLIFDHLKILLNVNDKPRKQIGF